VELILRKHQSKAVELLREGFKNGKMKQLFVAPTGAGKTELSIAMMEAVMQKGKRAAMILDRITLCDQTSQRLSKYDLDHGVLQSGHWRYKPSEQIQICSAQTLEKRGSFPAMDLLIVDEAHCTRKTTAEFIKNNPNLRVIGLTATPFTKGLADIYESVVQTITTSELIEQGLLAPLRVYVAKEIDMTGAKKVAGEWSGDEVTERGIKISGDIVSEWQKKTYEHFGKPEKTIIFASGVEHSNDLAEKFQAAGYNFLALSYKDDSEFTQQAIKEFSKPNSDIIGLISTDKLTKGFDVSDIKIGISARPFSKSLSSHIQQMGRVMRSHKDKEYALWLDHSGNYLRFMDDWDDVRENGVEELSSKTKKDVAKKELSDKEKEAAKCPVCSALWARGADSCLSCGFVHKGRNTVEVVPAEMQEIGEKTKATIIDKQDFYSSLLTYAHFKKYSDGWAANTYKDKFGVWPRNLEKVLAAEVSFDVRNFIMHKNIAFKFKKNKV
jgi:superfamily II DNA or RNA helicase